MKTKKAGILFLDDHLAFSPTTLNLQKSLSKKFNTFIITFPSADFKNLDENFVVQLKGIHLFFRITNLILRYFFFVKSFNKRFFYWQKILLANHLLFNSYEHLIVVDLKALWFVNGLRKKNIHLLSLELTEDKCDFYRNKVELSLLKSIIIQSAERLEYLTRNKYSGSVFFIQNAPAFNPQLTIPPRSQNNLVFIGSCYKEFGIFRCIDFIAKYPQYSLFIHGNIPSNFIDHISTQYFALLNNKNIILNSEYFKNTDELVTFTNSFRIGLCFYDEEYENMRCFNIQSAPSGKLFTYLAAGVPVIASNQKGLNIITEYAAGIQINDLSPESIKNAIIKIESNYVEFSENCLKAASILDFNINASKFASFLE